MSTAYQTSVYANKTPANGGHGDYNSSVHLHAISGAISTWATGDTISVGLLPRGAVVVSATVVAAAQLDSNATPTLAIDLGVTGATQTFKAAITTVGHSAGATGDQTLAPAGMLYKNLSAADIAVVCTVHTGAATPVSGTLQFDLEYYVEDVTGSNP